MANDDRIRYVKSKSNLFFFHCKQGFIEVVYGKTDRVKLGSDNKLVLRWVPNSLQASSDRVTVFRYQDPKGLNNGTVFIKKKSNLVLIDEDGKAYPANRAGFVKAFPELERMIGRYLMSRARDKEMVRFHNEEDVIALLNVCNKQRRLNLR